MDPEYQTTPPRQGTLSPDLPFVTPAGESIAHGSAPPTTTQIERILPRVIDIGGEQEEQQVRPQQERNVTENRPNKSPVAYAMYSPRAAAELPTIRTEKWPYDGHSPNPISIAKARKLLAVAYARVPCELDGADVHRHAWIIETKATWDRRRGTSTVTAPTKPIKELDYDIGKQMAYADNMDMYRVYHHLVQEGNSKLIEWFGEPMFVDLYVDGLLPAASTPTELLSHLEATYSQGHDLRRHMERVEQEFNAAYDPKKPVEHYFMRMQEARANAELLGQPYTDEQAMNKALLQFEKHLEKDAYKAEKKWNEKAPTVKTWAAFKTYWKKEVHQWEVAAKKTHQANQAIAEITTRMDSMQLAMSALETENRTIHERNDALVARQIQFRDALNAEQSRRQPEGDDMSTLTDYRSAYMAGLNAAVAAQSSLGGGTPSTVTDSGSRDTARLLAAARERAPDAYRNIDGGRGKRYNKYCFHCGVNCTHWTSRCYELTDADKARYRAATVDNTMNGSTHHIDRWKKYQKDYNFDSL